MNKEEGAQSLKNANVQPFAITGKPMAGWVMVAEKDGRARRRLKNGSRLEKSMLCRFRRKEQRRRRLRLYLKRF
jgi:hypothetical protein